MKGTIVKCIEGLVTTNYGADRWREILKSSGMSENTLVTGLANFPDTQVMTLMKSASSVLGISMEQVLEAFGDYWSTTYAPAIYKPYFDKAKTAREFLLSLDQIHVSMTKTVKDAAPPRFTYETKDDKHLVIHYNSPRGLVALMPGLIRGIAKKYGEKVDVSVKGDEVHIQFQ